MVKRGSVVLMVASRAYNKVRPGVVVQSDASTSHFDSLTICMITSEPSEGSQLRIPIEPNEDNGLKRSSWVQTEKLMTIPQVETRQVIGELTQMQMREIDVALATHLNLYALAPSQE